MQQSFAGQEDALAFEGMLLAVAGTEEARVWQVRPGEPAGPLLVGGVSRWSRGRRPPELRVFHGRPWLQWADRQAVLFDLPARKFYIFGWTFWPQDFFYLSLLLIAAAAARASGRRAPRPV